MKSDTRTHAYNENTTQRRTFDLENSAHVNWCVGVPRVPFEHIGNEI